MKVFLDKWSLHNRLIMEIRLIAEDDINPIYRLLCELKEYEMDYDKFCGVFNANLKDDNVMYMAAVDGDEVIGFISVHIQKLLHHLGSVAEIQELIVTDKYRNKGIGKVLVDSAKKYAEENNCAIIEVTTNRRRVRTHGFYEKQGMKKSHYKFTYEYK